MGGRVDGRMDEWIIRRDNWIWKNELINGSNDSRIILGWMERRRMHELYGWNKAWIDRKRNTKQE